MLNQCGNALKLFKVYESEENLYLVLEYQQGGTLLNTMKEGEPFKEADLQTIMG